jgi:DNA-binding transcriptional LysR family regulator
MRAGSTLETRSLEVFLAVCDAGGIGAAARVLDVSQSAISQQISKLETVLNLKLFERDNHGFKILPAGQTLQHHARRVMTELHATQNAMREFCGVKFPNVSVRVMDSLSKTLSNEVAHVLQGAVEQMQIGAAAVHTHRQDFLSGKTDILITSLDFEPGTFEIHHIATEPLVLIMPKRADPAKDFELDDLASTLPFVHYTDQRYLGAIADRYLAQQMVNVLRSIEVDQATAVIDTVRYGRAWAITSPFSLLDPAFEAKEIDVLCLPRPAPTRPINLVTRPGPLSQMARVLAAKCRDHLQQQMQTHLWGIVPNKALPTIIH